MSLTDLVDVAAPQPGIERPAGDLAADRTPVWLQRIAAAFVLFLVLGPLFAWQSWWSLPLDRTKGGNTFLVQYLRHEPIFLAIMAAFAVAVARLARRAPRGSRQKAAHVDFPAWGAKPLAVAALAVLAVAALGTWHVMHALPLAMDEYVADFQSRIFAAGQLTARVPAEWQRFTLALRPIFVASAPEGDLWASTYWPVYAALRALFASAGAANLLNPVLATLSVGLIYACARQLWPDHRPRACLAVAFLISSSQFVFMSMSAYAMPAHLCFNLLWLWAYLRGGRAGWIAAPLIGVAALGLHNPFPHALFVAPFLVQLLKQKRWAWTAYFAVVYGAGIALWYGWMMALHSSLSGAVHPSQVFAWPGLPMLITQWLSLSVLLSWQTPILAILLVWIVLARRTLATTERNLLVGVLLSFLFYFLFPRPQGHGWGYRYTYAVLGNMVLLGTLGATQITDALGAAMVRRLLVVSFALTALVQFPLRAWQIEQFVRPFALAHEYVERIDADVVIVDPSTSWYGMDLVRNDPFLRRNPKILNTFFLSPDDKRALAERFGDRVHLLTASEIARFSIPVFPSKFSKPVWPPPVTPVTRPAVEEPGSR